MISIRGHSRYESVRPIQSLLLFFYLPSNASLSDDAPGTVLEGLEYVLDDGLCSMIVCVCLYLSFCPQLPSDLCFHFSVSLA